MTCQINTDVLSAVRDGLVFYDCYDRRYVLQHAPGQTEDVSESVRALEDAGLIEPGTDTGGDMQPTSAGKEPRLEGEAR